MNNIYIDGSCNHKEKIIGIGIYNSTNNFELSIVKDGNSSSDAEFEALEECLRYCKMNNITNKSRIFTDSKEIHTKFYDYVIRNGIAEFIWIPRELNKRADQLSSQYKEYLKTEVTKISYNNNCIVKTTKIKEVSKTKSLSKEQIIDFLNEFSQEKRMKLIEKLKGNSRGNEVIFNYYFNNTSNIAAKKRNTYYFLIPLLVEVKSKLTREHLLGNISEHGLKELLNKVNIKETKV